MKHLTVYFPRKRAALALLCSLTFVVAALVYTQRASAVDQDIQKLNRFVQTNKGNTAAVETFKQGRDLIEAQNWQRAAEKFNDYIKGFPKDKDLDAALYWYGYALQKQGLKEDAKKPLERLMERFPGSSWRREAEALLVSMGYQSTVTEAANRESCEIKVLALQSLFQADEERAIALVTDSLKANSQTCPGFQSAAVSLLGAHAGPRAVPILLEIARTNPDLKLRLTAIKRLGEQHNAELERGRQLQAGIAAERELQLPARDTRRIRKAHKKEQKDIARGRAIREQAEQDGSSSGVPETNQKVAAGTGSHRRTRETES